MGHSDIRMARIYVHTSGDRQRSAVESVWGRKAKVIQMEKANWKTLVSFWSRGQYEEM